MRSRLRQPPCPALLPQGCTIGYKGSEKSWDIVPFAPEKIFGAADSAKRAGASATKRHPAASRRGEVVRESLIFSRFGVADSAEKSYICVTMRKLQCIGARIGLLAAVVLLAGVRAAGSVPPSGGVSVGMTDTAAYFPLLRGQRVAVLANHTAVAELPGCGVAPDAGGRVHLVDLLCEKGFDVVSVFSPEHGFRGDADAGAKVGDRRDPKTGVLVRSLYNGSAQRPSDEAMRGFDVLVVDMQDVGLRFYTYYISMVRMMEACADFGRRVVVLDRPNPHGDKVDGPLLDMRYKSGVGALPIPVLHGLTMGEIALMAVGEGWVAPCDVTVVACRRYTHATEYLLPVAPSPNLPTQRAVYLYPTVCLFEGTQLSVGRGTAAPFECFGHPGLGGYPVVFTPRPGPGAREPLFDGQACRGVDWSAMPLDEARAKGLDLEPLIAMYRALGGGDAFFKPIFEKLIGVGWVREMILRGASADEIRARWQPDVARYRQLRRRYLLYEEEPTENNNNNQ